MIHSGVRDSGFFCFTHSLEREKGFSQKNTD